MSVNSPGGSPVQCDQISDKTKVPVAVFVKDIAASGGYWIECSGIRLSGVCQFSDLWG